MNINISIYKIIDSQNGVYKTWSHNQTRVYKVYSHNQNRVYKVWYDKYQSYN